MCLQSCVTVCDINAEMLGEGQRRARDRGLGEILPSAVSRHASSAEQFPPLLPVDNQSLQWVQGNAEALPFPESCMDSYSIAFGIRNVTNISAALKEAHRVSEHGTSA